MARLSLLTNTFRHASYLANMIGAVAAQSRPPDEFMVLDDASTDHTWAVLEAAAARQPGLSILRNEVNQGAVRSFRRLLAISTGDYLWSCGSDDMILPGAIEAGMRLVEQYPQAGLCCGQGVWWTEGEEPYVGGLAMPDRDVYLSPRECVELARRGCLDLTGHTAIFKRTAFVEFGGFREELAWYSDWFVLYAIAFRHGICWTARPQAVMRITPGSFSAAGTARAAEQKKVLGRLARLLVEPAQADLRAALKESGLHAFLGWPFLRRLFRTPELWSLISPRYLAYLAEPGLRKCGPGRALMRRLRGTVCRTGPIALDLSAMRAAPGPQS